MAGLSLRVLGSGTSDGVPVPGCDCPVCRSRDRRDRRLRSSLLVRGSAGELAVIDTGPEFRLQAIRAGIGRLDAVFLTHSHADHIHGIDDLRPLSRESPLPVYGNPETIAELKERFSYVFRETQRGGGKPRLLPRTVSADTPDTPDTPDTFTGPVTVGGLRFSPIPVTHGALSILGWRVDAGDAAAVYLTDTSEIPGASWPLIGSPRVLIIGALRKRPHPTHFNFEQALDAALKTGAPRVFLTHICHDYRHRDIEKYCLRYRKERGIRNITVKPAYDGLEIGL